MGEYNETYHPGLVQKRAPKNDHAFAQRRSLVIRKLRAQGVELDADDFGRSGDYPTIDGMDATEWFEIMTEVDYVTAPTA